ncbi:MAG: hypothetical protein HKN91_01970 [Acidimicrobiia bacterium]|nr:hypothetical protein [Acidimicrobiia bacterium]
MSDATRPCARCRDSAVVTRGNAAYCMTCNELLDWAEIIALVQAADEPIDLSSADEASVAAAIAKGNVGETTVGRQDVVARALSVPAADVVEPDPFAQRLS